jgi:hypothetical protein
MKIKSVVAIGAMGIGLGLAAVAGAGTASAAPEDELNNTDIAAADEPTGAPWTDFFAAAPWEPFFDSTNGVLGDGKGAWESGVEAVNGGAWEKVFPPAE